MEIERKYFWSNPAMVFETRKQLQPVEGYRMVGTGEASRQCGTYNNVRCPVSHRVRGKLRYLVYHMVNDCDKRECPVCYNRWAARTARRIDHKLRYYKPETHRKRFIHLMLQPPHGKHGDITVNDAWNVLQVFMSKFSVRSWFAGGVGVRHDWQGGDHETHSGVNGEVSGVWREGKHFHFVVDGYLDYSDQGEFFRATGWFIKDLRRRKTNWGTFRYLLSHASFKKGTHAVKYFGALSYRNHKTPDQFPFRRAFKIYKDISCPVCHSKMEKVGMIKGWHPNYLKDHYEYYDTNYWDDH